MNQGCQSARWCLAFGLFLLAIGTVADEGIHGDASHAMHSLGRVDFPISCSPAAQAEFNRAVALLHHMTYPQARMAFEGVALLDPGCAMAQWGIAMTLFQPLWPTRPGPEALALGWQAVERAKALHPATAREQAFVSAAEAFFLEPGSADFWLRIRRWERAQREAYAALPGDDEAAAFYALAHLAAAPPDGTARTFSDEAAAILARVYAHNPEHPGAMHYLVHANDAPGREHEMLEVTRKYEAAAPHNPHALHMPTHIYTRLGDWDGVVRGNLLAADAALDYPAGNRGQFVWDEFPHAIEYLVYAYLQQGADDRAAAQIARLRATPNLEPTFKTAFHFASTQARYALERRDWQAAAQIVPREPAALPWDRFAWPEAISRFGRGLGAAQLGDLDAARAAITRLHELEVATQAAGEGLFSRNIAVLRIELGAWRAQREGKQDLAVALLVEASQLEASTPKHAVTPGPTVPADEWLGDLLMEQDNAAAALSAYRRSLDHYPRRFGSLLGAARAARTLGDIAAARGFYFTLLEVGQGGSRLPALTEARAFVRAAN